MTPMLKQYFEIKGQHEGALLFFRLGDFYELFGEDAKEAARLLGLTLTARHKGGPNEIPMCGVPHHSAEKYIAQLVSKGKHVAIADQVSDPSLPGIVQREVVKIITPGTTLDESITDTQQNHFILSLLRHKDQLGFALLDLGTGEFRAGEAESKSLNDLIYQIDPAEIIVAEEWEIADRAVTKHSSHFTDSPAELMQKHFGTQSLAGFGVEKLSLGLSAAARLLDYVRETQKTELDHLTNLLPWSQGEGLQLDESTIRNLELFHTSRDFKQEGSVIHTIDRTLTRMGARKLRQWLLQPLGKVETINQRLDAVEEITTESALRENLQIELKDFFDLERLLGRIGCRTVNARDLNYLKVNLMKVPSLKLILKEAQSEKLQSIHAELDECQDLVDLLNQHIAPEPPVTLTEGGMIADGFHAELDELRSVLQNGKDWLMNYQQKLRDETGINTLKVKFNKVFGYHIEVSKAQSAGVPESFELKQTLVNAHRYMSPELSEFAEKFLSAEERIKTLEYELFQQTLEEVIPFIDRVKKNAQLVATLDCLQGLAQLAITENYARPQIQEERVIEIADGRHPVIEAVLKKQHQSYIANDTHLHDGRQLIVLTGPNMAGKSSYLRQTALIVLMAHMGSFVPASSAQIGLTDRIFTRVGASDDISTGQSTFMVEMSEAANILNNATERSLIIFDELGRGTSTYDGVSIAWSVLEHLVNELGAFTLFATHYHELIDVARELPKAHNASIAVAEKDGNVVFLRKVVDEGVDRSYGIEVAKLAGLPQDVIRRAKQILTELEKDRREEEQSLMGNQASLFDLSVPSPHRHIIDRLKETDINKLSPLEALNTLSELQQDLEE